MHIIIRNVLCAFTGTAVGYIEGGFVSLLKVHFGPAYRLKEEVSGVCSHFLVLRAADYGWSVGSQWKMSLLMCNSMRGRR